ncbi:MAG: hypothetical protein KGO96_03540 [Elusimicrobia bacterium]|nr:hypothetical protein [Elusimicrobiota bacterium]MDE2237411.1 hypothetical protein [Elusimicrobiota bacterium]MDE2424966.1 hypothetical protein [Elusimicrobiota bacterium]
MSEAPKRGNPLLLALTLAALGGSCLLAAYWLFGSSRDSAVPMRGIDLSHVRSLPQAAASPRPSMPAAAMPQPASPAPVAAPGLAGFSRRPAGAAGQTSAPSAPPSLRVEEQAFLARHGAELAAYETKLGRITDRYYRQYPVVRQVNQEFGAMPRYMAIKRRFDRDGDPFQFARDAIALPEVRAEISRRMADPQAWRAALGMIFDALREAPPPAVIYKEAQHFMTQDPGVQQYLGQVSGDIQKNIPNALAGMPPGADVSRLAAMAQSLAPSASSR